MLLPFCDHPNVCQLLVGWYVLGGSILVAVAIMAIMSIVDTWRAKR